MSISPTLSHTQAMLLDERFGLDAIVCRAVTQSPLKPEELRLHMRAWSLNYRDFLVAVGAYLPKMPFPRILLSDGVGIITEMGEQAAAQNPYLSVGMRVCPTFCRDWLDGPPTLTTAATDRGGRVDGVCADSIVVPAYSVVPVPEYLSDAQAATLPCAALTAWTALFRYDAITPNSTVLVQGTGGVSTFAAQFAKAIGARVIVTSSSDEKLAWFLEKGWADIGINYRQEPEWGKKVLQLTQKHGVDHIIEVGGADSLNQSLVAIRMGGQISVIGMLGGGVGSVNVIPLLMKGVRVQGVFVGNKADFVAMNAFLQHHIIVPHIAHTHNVRDMPQALEALSRGEYTGKCVLLPPF